MNAWSDIDWTEEGKDTPGQAWKSGGKWLRNRLIWHTQKCVGTWLKKIHVQDGNAVGDTFVQVLVQWTCTQA